MKATQSHILLVEDNEDDILMLQEVFAETGLTDAVRVISDSEEVITYLLRQLQQDSTQLPQLILLDINMPKKNGFEVLTAIKSDGNLRHIPVVMLTTSEREEDILRAFANGACSYVPKPVGFDKSVTTFRLFCNYWKSVSRLPAVQPLRWS